MYRFASITAEEAVAFRRRHLGNTSLISDHWDGASTHHAVLRNSEIVGASRLTQISKVGLPFMEYVSLDAQVKNGGVEIGRFLVTPSLRKTYIGWCLFKHLVLKIQDIRPACQHVYVDSIVQKDLLHRGMKRFGFEQTNVEYFDPRYQARGIVFEASLPTLLAHIRDRAAVL